MKPASRWIADRAVRHLARHVVLLEPDQRPGDAQRVRMPVRRVHRGSCRCERRVASAVSAGHRAAHAQSHEVDELVLAVWQQCEDTFDLVGGRFSFETEDAELQRQEQHRRRASAVGVGQELRVSHERTVCPLEISLAHAEIGLDEHQVSEHDRIRGELPCSSRMTGRTRDIPGSMCRPGGVRQSLSAGLVRNGEPRGDLERTNGGARRAARERASCGCVELGSDRLVRLDRCRCTMPGLAIDVLVDFRQERVGFTPGTFALSLVDDRADERVAERNVAVLEGRETVELRCLEIPEIELGLSKRCGERDLGVGAGSSREQQRMPRSFGEARDASTEGALDPAVHGNGLTELVDSSKLRVGECRRQLDESERVPRRDLEETPSDRSIERNTCRAGEKRACVLRPETRELEPRHVPCRLGVARPHERHTAVRCEASRGVARRTRSTSATIRRPTASRRRPPAPAGAMREPRARRAWRRRQRVRRRDQRPPPALARIVVPWPEARGALRSLARRVEEVRGESRTGGRRLTRDRMPAAPSRRSPHAPRRGPATRSCPSPDRR